LFSLSLSVGCSTAPIDQPAQGESSIQIRAITGHMDWVSTLVHNLSREPRQLPPAVMPPGPSYHRDTNPRGPACALCPGAMGAQLSASGWELAGRPDPIEIASALGHPELATAISDHIVDSEIALSETPAGDTAGASAIVTALANDLDRLAQAL
jgi:hypothetical protein